MIFDINISNQCELGEYNLTPLVAAQIDARALKAGPACCQNPLYCLFQPITHKSIHCSPQNLPYLQPHHKSKTPKRYPIQNDISTSKGRWCSPTSVLHCEVFSLLSLSSITAVHCLLSLSSVTICCHCLVSLSIVTVHSLVSLSGVTLQCYYLVLLMGHGA